MTIRIGFDGYDWAAAAPVRHTSSRARIKRTDLCTYTVVRLLWCFLLLTEQSDAACQTSTSLLPRGAVSIEWDFPPPSLGKRRRSWHLERTLRETHLHEACRPERAPRRRGAGRGVSRHCETPEGPGPHHRRRNRRR